MKALEISPEMQTCSWERRAYIIKIPNVERMPVFEMLYLKAFPSLNSSDPYRSPKKKAEQNGHKPVRGEKVGLRQVTLLAKARGPRRRQIPAWNTGPWCCPVPLSQH